MNAMPIDRTLDNTLALFSDPYGFIPSRARRFGSDVFETRLLLRPTICMTGAAAAEVFYDPARFQRAGTAPEPLRARLFGKRAAQTFDAAVHHATHAISMRALAPERVDALARSVGLCWRDAASRWPAAIETPLYAAAQAVLTRAACAWAGVPLAEADVRRRSAQLLALYDDAPRGLGAHLNSRRSRNRAEAWLRREIERVRLTAPPEWIKSPDPAGSGYSMAPYAVGAISNLSALGPPRNALHDVATHRDEQGRLLPAEVAAGQLLDILRPAVAVSVFIVFAVHALLFNPALRHQLLDRDAACRDRFANEVRRYYPFFPAVMAVVREDFEWKGFLFQRGRRALLDLYGTNHDPRIWSRPAVFDPDRFLAPAPLPLELIPQGGAHAATGHRYPGERATMVTINATLDFLLNHARWVATPHDDRIHTRRLPALPRATLLVGPLSRRHALAVP
jgi:fatty-acid peroxygenase